MSFLISTARSPGCATAGRASCSSFSGPITRPGRASGRRTFTICSFPKFSPSTASRAFSRCAAFASASAGAAALVPPRRICSREYQSRLDAVIARRVRDLQAGRAAPDDFVVRGARAFLEKLRRRGLRLIILSGTIEPRVREEARRLGLDGYFGRHIYGGTADPAQFSKKLVIDRLLAEEAISGSQMVSFGDGPVEIRETKNAGGLAVAVASDEENNGSGRPDPWKREQLLQAGADAVAADFQAADDLLKMIFGSSSW